MSALIKARLLELPEGATYVRARGDTTCGVQPKGVSWCHVHDVFVGYILKSRRFDKYCKDVREYEIYHLRQWDFPICIPIDKGGCYTGDISGFTTGYFPIGCHPIEAITVDEMFKRMEIARESVVTKC